MDHADCLHTDRHTRKKKETRASFCSGGFQGCPTVGVIRREDEDELSDIIVLKMSTIKN